MYAGMKLPVIYPSRFHHLAGPSRPIVGTVRDRSTKAPIPGMGVTVYARGRESFVHLRLPLLFTLRRDTFEKSSDNANTYHDWMIDRAYVLVPLQAVATEFLMTMKEFPPSQAPGDWSLDSLEKQIKGMTTAGE